MTNPNKPGGAPPSNKSSEHPCPLCEGVIRDGIHHARPETEWSARERVGEKPFEGGWEKQFAKLFPLKWWKGFGSTDDIDKQGIEGIKSFIRTQLSLAKKQGQEEMNDMIKRK